MKSFLERWIYTLGIRLYGLSVLIASPFSLKAKKWIAGRKQLFPKIPAKSGRTIWFHCASLGEFEQARPVIEKWRTLNQNDKIILSFFSPSGYEIRKDYKHADAVVYLPLDTPANAKKFLDWAQPDVALFVKYEFWFHHLNELKQREIPGILFSSIFRSDQTFFKWYGASFKDVLKLFSNILVQNKASHDLLKSISLNSQIAFDTRFDRVYQIAEEKKSFPAIDKFRRDCKVFIAGSTWAKDEEMIASLIHSEALTSVKFIIAPHEINEERILSLQERVKVKSQRLSQFTNDTDTETRVLIIDSIGFLASLYSYADIAYVGGGFNASIHNILEPAVYGIPVMVGPRHEKSLEALELIKSEGVLAINNEVQLYDKVNELLKSENLKDRFAKNREYVIQRTGGTALVLKELNYWLGIAESTGVATGGG